MPADSFPPYAPYAWRMVRAARLVTRPAPLPGGTRARWWELTLECGHVRQGEVKYAAREGARAYGRAYRDPAEARPPPARVRCYSCGRGMRA